MKKLETKLKKFCLEYIRWVCTWMFEKFSIFFFFSLSKVLFALIMTELLSYHQNCRKLTKVCFTKSLLWMF